MLRWDYPWIRTTTNSHSNSTTYSYNYNIDFNEFVPIRDIAISHVGSSNNHESMDVNSLTFKRIREGTD